MSIHLYAKERVKNRCFVLEGKYLSKVGAVNSYSDDDIQVLEGLEAVRKDRVCILVQQMQEVCII